jgi:adenylylsulfate kinase-like enzyme
MMNINGQNHEIEFRRHVEPVTFFHRGRKVTQNRMATTAVLVNQQGEILDTATVKPFHRDRYSRRKANEAAVHKLANQFDSGTSVQILKGFFNKPE